MTLIRLAALHVLDLDQPYGAKLPVLDHGPRLPHHRVARVIVGKAEDQPAVCHDFVQDFGLLHVIGHGLVANNIKARLQRRPGVFQVAVVRRHDRDDVGAVLATCFRLQHLGNVDVSPVFSQADVLAGLAGTLGIARQDGRDDLVAVVQAGRLPVHPADK